jgi:Protein of unknown function (DUF5131)
VLQQARAAVSARRRRRHEDLERPTRVRCVPEWARRLRDETKGAGRAFFFKQWGDGSFSKKWLKEIGRTIDGCEWNESPWSVALPINQEEGYEKTEAAVAAGM